MVTVNADENGANGPCFDEELMHLLAKEVEDFVSLGLEVQDDAKQAKLPSKALPKDHPSHCLNGGAQPRSQPHQLRQEVKELQLCAEALIKKRREQQQEEFRKSCKRSADSLAGCNNSNKHSNQSNCGATTTISGSSMTVTLYPSPSRSPPPSRQKRARHSSCDQPFQASRSCQNNSMHDDLMHQMNQLIIRQQKNPKYRRLAPRTDSKKSAGETSWLMDPANDTARLRWLLQRLEFSCEQMDLVFQQRTIRLLQMSPQADSDSDPDKSVWNWEPKSGVLLVPKAMPMSKPVPNILPLLAPVRVSPYEHMISLHDTFAEMAGSKLTRFDASTFLSVLWWVFSMQTRNSMRPPAANPLFDVAYENGLMESLVHGTVRYTAMIQHIQMPVKVEVHGVLKKLANGLVWETVGHMEPDTSGVAGFSSKKHKTRKEEMVLSLAKMEFSRSSWSRVDPSEGGQSVVHHVHRIAPIVNGQTSQSLPPGMHEKEYRQHQLQILAEMLQAGREQTIQLIHQFLLERFPHLPQGFRDQIGGSFATCGCA